MESNSKPILKSQNSFSFSTSQLNKSQQILNVSNTHTSGTNPKSSKESYLAEQTLSENRQLCESLTQAETINELDDPQNLLFHPNGNQKYEGELKNGKKNGYGKIYHYNKRQLYEGTFVEDRIESDKAVIFHYNGEIKYQGGYVKGRRHGKGIQYHTNRALRYKGWFKYGKIHDENAVLYFGNGQIEYEGGIILGKKAGKGCVYNNDGSLKKSGVFKEGKLVKDLTDSTILKKSGISSKNHKNPKQSGVSGYAGGQELPLKRNLQKDSQTQQQAKIQQKQAKFRPIQFNIDFAYMKKIVKQSITQVNINFGYNEKAIQDFISNYRKNENLAIYDENNVKRFEGMCFMSKRQGVCNEYNQAGMLIKRATYLNDQQQGYGLKFHTNGKFCQKGDFSKHLQDENGFSISYHKNGCIAKIGQQCLGMYMNTYVEMFDNGGFKCLREKSGTAGGIIFYEDEGVLFYPDGSVRHRGESDHWGYD